LILILQMREGLLLLFLSISLLGIHCKTIKYFLTTSDSNGKATNLLAEQPPLKFGNVSIDSELLTLHINTSTFFQDIQGYGAGLPQSSALVLMNLKANQPSLYFELLEKLFGKVEGASISAIRFPIGSCDFSMTNTTYDEVDSDFNLEKFAVDTDSKLIFDVLRDVVKINPTIKLIGIYHFLILLICHYLCCSISMVSSFLAENPTLTHSIFPRQHFN
jgi:hypothetical protein